MTGTSVLLSDLLVRISKGDVDAMADLYQGTSPTLVAYIRKFVRDSWDADEVIQDVYRHVWLHSANYSSDRGVPMAWLYTIARSRAIDKLRHSRNTLAQPLPDDCRVEDGERQQVIRFEAGLVRKALSHLPDQQRHFILMAFVDGYSHSEIANRTGIPLGTVKGRIRAALLKMRELLGDNLASTKTEPLPSTRHTVEGRSGLQLVSMRSSRPPEPSDHAA